MKHSFFSRCYHSKIAHLATLILAALAFSNLAFCGEILDAAKNGDLGKVKALLKDNPDLVFSKDNYGGTPLFLAALTGHKDVATFLLANKADVNAKENNGWTPLHAASGEGYKDMVELLLTNKADVDAKDNNDETPLFSSSLKGHKDVAELLLANKADVNAKENHGVTPLQIAAGNGHKDVVELLLANKADVNAKDNLGRTPLHEAAASGYKDVVELLLVSKADVNAKANNGDTPLAVATANSHDDVAELLRQHGGREYSTEIERTTFIDRMTFSMSLPDKWTENTNDDNYNSNSFVFFEGPEQGFFFVMIGKKSAGASVDILVNAQRDELSKKFTDAAITKITKWSSFDGNGLIIEGKIMGILNARATIFGFEKADNVCLVEEYSSLRGYNKYGKDFATMRQTFRVK